MQERCAYDGKYQFFAPPRMPDKPSVSSMFSIFASDPAPGSRGPRSYNTADLWNEVIAKGGKVDAATARRFANDALSGVFANDARITDPRAKQGLSTLGFETIISLYESIATEDAPGLSLYLRELNVALDLQDSFYEKQADPMARFFSPANTAFLEQKWAEAKRAGKIGATEPGFSDAMAQALTNEPIWNEGDLERQMNLFQFLCNAYGDFTGEAVSPKVGLFKGPPGLKGFHASKADTGTEEIIAINVLELGSFQNCLGILMHERQHASQERLAEAYQAGQIKKGDANYEAARIFAANRAGHGYLNPDHEAGPAGYRFQPLEMDAHNAGSIAEYMVFKTYARMPGVYTERKLKTPAPGQRLSAA